MKYFALGGTLLLLMTCVDPVTPAFNIRDGFLLIEGQVIDQPGLSEVRVSQSELLFGNYTLVPIQGATVSSIDSQGEEVNWTLIPTTNRYQPPANFVGQTGETYYIRVVTPDGQIVESTPERMPNAVPIQNAEVRFEQEAYFSDGRNRFIPAFRLLVDFEDPANEQNYYQWKFRSWEFLDVCARCERSVWREGECISTPDSRFVPRYDYLCDAPCWTTSRSSQINILSDEFSQGQRIENIEAGRVDFDWPGGLLLEVQQLSTTKAQFEYNQVLENLAEGSGGLNATLPAALIGNLQEVSDSGINALGFVGAASVAVERIYFDRDTVDGQPLPFDASIRLEPLLPSPPVAPCEGINRSRIRPVGWPE
ncbi:MAG: DUF4249 domain-containing protein [Bacteroidota bacterium]